MKNIIILSLLFMSSSLIASTTSGIQSVLLEDGSTLKKTELESVIFSDNRIEYLTLKDGSKVEGTEIKSFKLIKKGTFAPQVRAAVRTGGDGTGG